MKHFLAAIICAATIVGCKQQTTTTVTTRTDEKVKDNLIPLVAAVDTIKTDSIPVVSPSTDSILPGKSIGQITLGETTEQIIAVLGKPDSSDAAMQKVSMAWFSKPSMQNADTVINTIKIFAVTTGKAGADVATKVKRIRITSPVFKTATHVGCGNTFSFIKLQYPTLKKPVDKIKNAKGQVVELYDESKEGISFEIIDNKCSAIIVHEPGQKNLALSL